MFLLCCGNVAEFGDDRIKTNRPKEADGPSHRLLIIFETPRAIEQNGWLRFLPSSLAIPTSAKKASDP